MQYYKKDNHIKKDNMKTVKQIIEKHYKLDTDEEGNAVMYLGQIEDLLLEYGKQLLIEASEKATIILKDVYSEDFRIVKDEIVRYNPKGVNSVYPDDCFKHSMKINSESILNIINELK